MKKHIQLAIIALILSSFVFANELQAAKKKRGEKRADAVTKKVKKSTKKIEDYSKGFAKFAKFGLPNVKDAKYIKLNMYSSAFSNNDYFRYQAKVKGNAWLISEDKKSGKAEIVIHQGAVATVYDQQKLINTITKKRQKEAEKNKKKNGSVSYTITDFTEGKLAGTWEKADLKKDADKITEHIRKEMQKDYFFGKESLGLWFLFAIHLDQKGLKEEANKLAGVLFDAGKGKRIVILQALNAIADSQYGVAYATFKENHDWKSYSASIKKIYATFRKGWKKAAGIKKLSELIAKRAEGVPVVDVKDLSESDKVLIKELLEKPLTSIQNSIWVLKEKKHSTPEKGKESDGEADEQEEPTVIAKIMDKGMASVPLLIKLLGNDTLVVADSNDLRMFGGGRFYSNRSSGNANDADRIFKQLKRPMTLGEVARRVLDPIVIQEIETDSNGNEIRRSSGGDDTDEFREVAETWYKANQKKTPLELAQLYLKDGSKAQKSFAVSYFLKKKIKSEYPKIEKFLLSGKRSRYGNGFQDKLAVRYAGSRGVAAKEFAKKYIDKLDPDSEMQKAAEEAKKQKAKKGVAKKKKSTDSSEEESSDSSTISTYEREQILKTIDELKAMTSDETVEDIINDILGDKREWNIKQKNLLSTRLRMSDEDIDSKLAVILKSALKAAEKNRSKVFMDLMKMAVRISKNISTPVNMFNFMRNNDNIEDEIADPNPEKNREIWEKLLTSKIITEDYGTNDDSSITLGDAVAIFYDGIYFKKSYTEARFNLYILGEKLLTLMKQRAMKNIAGVPEDKLPKLPSIADLTDEQRDKQIADVVQKVRSSQNKLKRVQALTLNEILLLKLGLEKDKKLSTELYKLSNRIAKVKTDMPGAKKFAKFAGKHFSATMINDIRAFAVKSQRDKKNIYCRIYKKPLLGEFSIFIGEIPKDQLSTEMKNRKKDANIIIVGLMKVPGAFNAKAYWPLTEEKEVVKSTESSEDDDLFGDMEEEIQNESKDFYADRQNSFNEKIKLLEDGNLNSMLSGGIYFLGGVE